MDISNHISSLLNYNECVIIPDFGSFISNYIPSKFEPAKKVYLPPSKEVVFNSKITKNDGLLISYLVESESISYSQAYQAVNNWVNNAFVTLNEGEKLEMNGVGSIVFDRNGSIIFTASVPNILADAFGLDAVSFPKLVRPVYVNSYNPRPAVSAISNRKSAVRIAAAITLVLSLSLFPMKIKKENFIYEVSNLNPFTALTTEKTEEPAPIAEPKPEIKPAAVPEKFNFILVGGSFEVEENANSYREKLLKDGNRAEVVKLNNGKFRVIIDSYKTRDEALTAMENYRATHTGSQVWVSNR
jgi:nucleoid DNA-binding protein